MLAAGLRRLELHLWAAEVHRWANFGESEPASSLCGWSCAIETHKRDGLATARSIHSSTGHVFNALGEVVCRMVSPAWREHSHICWRSEGVIALARTVRVASRSILPTYDAREFHLSGERDQLARHACNVVQGPWSTWFGACR